MKLTKNNNKMKRNAQAGLISKNLFELMINHQLKDMLPQKTL